MAKKTYNRPVGYKTFNKRALPKRPDGLLEKIVTSAEKVVASYGEVDYNRWGMTERFQEMFEKTWEAKDPHFLRWWLDTAVREVECWVWNAMQEQDAKDSRKRDRMADEAMVKFRKEWL